MRHLGIPEPENGMVVRFHYRWADPNQPVKERPACIAFVRSVVPARNNPEKRGEAGYVKEVVYLPISTRSPRPDQTGIEIPAAICNLLGLRDIRSWVIVSECHVQYWPTDLGRVPGRARQWHYGFMPPRFFARITEVFRSELRRRAATVQNVHYLPPRGRET